jgi:hypothetical protein
MFKAETLTEHFSGEDCIADSIQTHTLPTLLLKICLDDGDKVYSSAA